MAYTQFFVASGGNNKNSGSTSSTSPIYSSTSGNWVAATGVFTPTDGSTPASTVSVNDWVSVCTNASSATSYLGQVTAVVAGVNGAITVAITGNEFGAVLANQTGTCTLIDGGCWADLTPVANFGTFTCPVSTEICIKAATYTLTASATLNLIGTATVALWYRGYNTTVGDLDNGSTSLSYPTFAGGANYQVNYASGYSYVSGIAFTTAKTSSALINTALQAHFNHCRFTNTNANANSFAVNTGSSSLWTDCYFTATSTASEVVSSSQSVTMVGCYILGAGGSTSYGILSTNNLTLIDCTINGVGSHGIYMNSGSTTVQISGCTFYNCAGDSIHFNAFNAVCTVTNCAFFNSGAYDINNATGTNTNGIKLANNLTYNAGTAHSNGFGDAKEFNLLTDVTQSYVSSTNLALVSGSAGSGAGLPGQWENLTSGLGGFPDVGAWSRAAGASSVGLRSTVQPGSYRFIG